MEDLEQYESFLAQLTHNIQTSLVNTRNTASIIRRELSSSKPNLKKIDDMLLDIEMHMKTSMSIVDSIRYRRSDFIDQFSSRDVGGGLLISLIKQVEHLCRRHERHSTCRTELRICADLERNKFHLDPKALEICLTNLASNASKYALEGSTIIYLVRDQPHAVDVVIRNAINEKNAATFENWGRHGYSTDHASTGLGLHIVKKICEDQKLKFSQKIQKDSSTTWVSSSVSIPKSLS